MAFQRKWLVSCKHNAHLGRSVGIDDIVDFSGACDAVGAEGFLLIYSTQPTSSVVNQFEEVERRGRILARFWDGIED